jgi:hypothetical protein
MKTENAGIDYGLGRTNIDTETGIRFGVIPQNAVGSAWFDSSEPDYGDPTCPKCGHEAKKAKGEYARYEHARHECDDYVCHRCKYVFGSESAYGECQGCVIDDGEYKARSDDRGDIWVFASPYYTRAQFCSPCAPGACYLTSECETGAKAYCLGHDWFDGGKAPYTVYSVETGEVVEAAKEATR